MDMKRKKKSSNTKTVERDRDAKTGRYVTKEYAKKHPTTTITEHDKITRKK
jgi:hypothetical protein